MKRETTCVHFNGVQHKTCEAGLAYDAVARDHDAIEYAGADGRVYRARRSLPCLPPNAAGVTCEARRFPTPEEIAADEARIARFMDCLGRGVSPCCEAPLDASLVAKSGRHEGTGPRLCSKCRTVIFHGCGRGSIRGGR